MNQKTFSRRKMLRGAGGAVLALPYLELMAGRARAQTAAAPKRLVIYFNGEGNLIDQWKPAVASGSALPAALPPSLAAISSYKSKLNLLYPIDNVVAPTMPGNDHNRAGRSLLTCNIFTGGETSAAAGPSIDQYIKQKLGLTSLELRVGDPNDVGEYQMLFSAAGQAVTGESDPQKIFNRLFSTLPAVGATTPTTPVPVALTPAQRLAQKRKDVLSLVSQDFTALRSQAGVDDRARLDAHAQRVQDLQAEVAAAMTPIPTVPTRSMASCSKPVLAAAVDHPSRNKAQMQNAAMAMACNLAQVVTIQDTRYDVQPFEWLGLSFPNGWHGSVHDRSPLPMLQQGFAWYATAFKNLLDAMDAVDEGNGNTLLDNSLVVWITEFGDAAVHNTHGIPVVLAGKLGGALKTDRYIEFATGSASTNKLFVTIMNLFGIAENTFGVGSMPSGILPGIV